MLDFSTKFSEYKLEKLMGGESRFGAIWHALVDKGLRFVSCGSTNNTIVFGMDKNRIWTFSITNEVFFQKARDLTGDADEFAETIIKLMAKKNPKLELTNGKLPTMELVHDSYPHRVLWHMGVNLLEAEFDRMYDDCVEMGDGSLVMETVRRIKAEMAIPKISDCKISKVTPFTKNKRASNSVQNVFMNNFDLFTPNYENC